MTTERIVSLDEAKRRAGRADDQEDGATPSREWPKLNEAALHGLAGEVVRTIDPHTEADPVAILVQFLAAVGRGPHFRAEADHHGANLFVILVAETAKGRKGSSWGQARRIVAMADESWSARVVSGLSSGEGLIAQVRDPTEKREPIKEKGRITSYQTTIEDHGVADKRLLVFEGEFASALQMMKRQGNTLSPVIRNAWDSGSLSTLTKNSPVRATGAHISIVGHITRGELLRHLDDTEAGNGFANRFLPLVVRRSKPLPDGGSLDEGCDLTPLACEVKKTLEFARQLQREVKRDTEARRIWHRVYPDLSAGKPGLLGAVTARAEAQVMRLALIYALLDRSPAIRAEHLSAALAVWEYVEASAEYIFGDRFGDPVADTILDALRQAPDGLTRTSINNDLFGRNVPASRIKTALDALLAAKKARRVTESVTRGRPAERWFATTAGASPFAFS